MAESASFVATIQYTRTDQQVRARRSAATRPPGRPASLPAVTVMSVARRIDGTNIISRNVLIEIRHHATPNTATSSPSSPRRPVWESWPDHSVIPPAPDRCASLGKRRQRDGEASAEKCE